MDGVSESIGRKSKITRKYQNGIWIFDCDDETCKECLKRLNQFPKEISVKIEKDGEDKASRS